MNKSDLYLMEEPEDLDCSCDRCGASVSDSAELFPYYEIYVCEDCFDKLNIRDEKERIEFESDGLVEYEE